jgi:hypothetical protein
VLGDGQPRLQQEEDQVTHRFSRRFTGLSGPTVGDDRSWRTVQDVQCRHAGLWLVAGLVLESKFILLNVIVTQVLGGVVTGRQLSSIKGGSGPNSPSPPWSPFHSTHSSKQKSFSVRGRDGVIGGGYGGPGAERQRERELGSFCKFYILERWEVSGCYGGRRYRGCGVI